MSEKKNLIWALVRSMALMGFVSLFFLRLAVGASGNGLVERLLGAEPADPQYYAIQLASNETFPIESQEEANVKVFTLGAGAVVMLLSMLFPVGFQALLALIEAIMDSANWHNMWVGAVLGAGMGALMLELGLRWYASLLDLNLVPGATLAMGLIMGAVAGAWQTAQKQADRIYG